MRRFDLLFRPGDEDGVRLVNSISTGFLPWRVVNHEAHLKPSVSQVGARTALTQAGMTSLAGP